MDGAEHRLRLEAMAGDELPGIVYVPCSRPLADDVDRLRRIVAKHELGYLVVDSVGLACDGPPEAAEVAVRSFKDCGSWVSVRCSSPTSTAAATPTGRSAAFWHNGARRPGTSNVESDIGSDSIAVGLFAKKCNTGPLPAPLGYRVDWPEDGSHRPADVRDIPDISSHVPLRYRIATPSATAPSPWPRSLPSSRCPWIALRRPSPVMSPRHSSGVHRPGRRLTAGADFMPRERQGTSVPRVPSEYPYRGQRDRTPGVYTPCPLSPVPQYPIQERDTTRAGYAAAGPSSTNPERAGGPGADRYPRVMRPR